jgi:hypothetical protein
MNVSVKAGPLTISIKAVVNNVVVSVTTSRVGYSGTEKQLWACFSSYKTSINGHSMNAINPDFFKVGELTTSALA